MKSLFEEMGGTYRQEGDYLIPNLTLPDEPEYQIGKYGRMRRRYLKGHRRLCSKNSVNATSVTKSEISRFRSRRPLPPDPYCSAPTQPPPLAAAWPWQVIGKNAKLNRRRDTFVSEISEFRHRRRDSYSIFTDVLSRRASIEPAGALSIEPTGAYVPDSLPGYMIASSA